MRLTGILDNDEIVLASQIENWVHIGRLAVDVNGTTAVTGACSFR